MQFQKEVEKALKKAGVKKIKLEKPPNPKFGDLSFPCFEIAKGKNPSEVAKEIAEKVKPTGLIGKVVPMGPYVNFFIDSKKFAKKALKEILKPNFGKGKRKGKALIEHTSINPNASPHVGRARNALIGDAITRLLKFYGHQTEVHYFVNDVGKQIAMLVYATKELKGKPKFEDMLKHYIEINRKVIENASIEREIFELLEKLESGDKKTIKEFEKIVSICVKGQTKILGELGIKYDYFDYESKFLKSKLLKDILETFKKKRKLKQAEDGRTVLDLSEFNLPMREPYLPLTRANGTSLYALRDIAYNVYKAKKVKKGKNIVVLGEDHKLEFQQIKAALSILGHKAPEVIHYSFILLPEGKMSTRKGNVVLLTDFMKEAVEKAKEEILKRNPDIAAKELEKLSKVIGYGALKYSILRVSPDKNVIFEWDEALNFEGNSAPYIQYTYVRSKRILEKLGRIKQPKDILVNDIETELIKKIAELPSIIESTARDYSIHKIAHYAYELANLFNNFYETSPIISEKDENKKMTRALIVKVYKNTIKNVLWILGIDAPNFM
ncbi:MAG: arginine--tRNA ligase [Nanoarchaeota archaeon]|nr:arginine--tRNA ligase [Nanoarchaeota archaeon]